jgi:hypothetical protein
MKKTNKLQDKLLSVFPFIALIILGFKISNWFLNFDTETNEIINTVMFVFIGLFYILMGFQFVHKGMKTLLLVSGVYLIIMNFITTNFLVSIIGILLILIPLLIFRFNKQLN